MNVNDHAGDEQARREEHRDADVRADLIRAEEAGRSGEQGAETEHPHHDARLRQRRGHADAT